MPKPTRLPRQKPIARSPQPAAQDLTLVVLEADAANRPHHKGRVLIVDDLSDSMRRLETYLHRHWPEWTIEFVESAEAAQKFLAECLDSEAGLPDLVSIDLGLDQTQGFNNPQPGLALLRDLRRKLGGLTLMVHSGLEADATIVREVMSMNLAYIQTRERTAMEAFAAMVPFLAKGYLVYSPQIVNHFPFVVTPPRDPLDADEWRLLQFLAQTSPARLSYEEISVKLFVSVGKINQRVRSVAYKLREAKLISFEGDNRSVPDRYRPLLETFYSEHHARYGFVPK